MSANDHDSEVTATEMVITCRTAGCPHDGVPFTARMYPRPNPPVWAAVCAVCDQMVPDIVPAP
ncbi:hypothetical protein [Streptomyces microflavus]|uniref:hypothetical protein n=1 Tax=Streptomyces microflavus TaxID=1919 RepID=UPI0036569810